MISRTRIWLPLLVVVSALAIATSADSAYVVEGLTLGARVPVGSSNYQRYACRSSEDFARLTWCRRSDQRGTFVASSAIMHTEDGTAVYLMVNVAPVSLSRNVVQSEIEQLTREIKDSVAAVTWFAPRQGLPTSVVAVWGRVKLEQLKGDEIATLAAGKSPRVGILVDSLGDLQRSAEQGLPVYRMTAGPGYVYAASFDAAGRGHRHYVAINPSVLAVHQFERILEVILQKDQSLASNDDQLWPEVAKATRRLSLDTSPDTANQALDKVFEKFPSKKLRSHVWSILPGGAVEHMAMHQYGTIDIYGPKTKHPEIRRAIQNFLATHPSEPFVEFLHYVIGEPDKALQTNPNSSINDVFHYAIGHRILDSVLQDVMKVARPRMGKYDYEPTTVDGRLGFLNQNPQLYDHKPLVEVVPNFAARAAAAQPHFEAVLRNPSTPHADDAAYMLGWLALHQNKPKEALAYLSQAMSVGNADYDYKRPAAMRQAVRILDRYSPREQMTIVSSDRVFAQQPALWYVAARSAYRDYDYALAIMCGERALQALNVPLERLPATTDPRRIESALKNINPQLLHDDNLVEIPYLVQSSREFLQYEGSLKSLSSVGPHDAAKRARAIIVKYSLLVEQPEQPARGSRSRELAHRDLRQAQHLIDLTLEGTPKNADYGPLREWLYYRKSRILATFSPRATAATVTAFQEEFPGSALVPHALTEQLYAQAVMLRDLDSAQKTFRRLLDKYPRSNAIDNAYTWLAIVFRCEGRAEEAQRMNREIVRLFPLTRHARYARERMTNPKGCGLP
jgi:tetratricopeptide (TPR) repeat protein